MLSDKLREGAQGRIFKILFWIIILSFVFTGVGSYLIPRINTDPVMVGDYKISANEWTGQYNRQTQQLQRMYGNQASQLFEDRNYMRSLRMQVLEGIVNNVAFNTAVFKTDMRIGDEQVRDVIRRTPAFFKDGKFDNNLYLAAVRNMGMDPEYFGEQMRTSLTASSISEPVLNLGSLPLPYEVDEISRVMMQARIIDLYTLDSNVLKDGIEASDADVRAYYDAHTDRYMAPASAAFTYLLLDANNLKGQIEYTTNDLEDYLTFNPEEFRVGERRELKHILVRSGDGAQEKIAAIDKALSDGSQTFEELATLYSDDAATAQSGGSLGAVGHHELAEDLENAAFALQEGQVSEKISDNYGTHYLKLDKIIPSYVPAFDKIKDKVAMAYTAAKARSLFNEQVTTLSDLSFENPDSLDVTAQELNLPILECKELVQGDQKAPWPLNTKAMQDAVFDEDNLMGGVNTPVVAISDGVAVVMNIHDHTESALRPFEEVQSQAKEDLTAQRAVALGDKILEDYAKALAEDPSAPLPQNVRQIEGLRLERGSNAVDPQFGMAVFAIPQEPQHSWCVGENRGQAALAVLKEVQIAKGEEASQYAPLIASELRQVKMQQGQAAIFKLARSLVEITYNQEAIDLVNNANAD